MREPQALVLSPTRELATQIQSVLLALGDYMNVQVSALGNSARNLEKSGRPTVALAELALEKISGSWIMVSMSFLVLLVESTT
jgi:hypothetical protein